MAMMKHAAGRRSRADGERLVAQFERSGLKRRAFCAAQSVSVNTLDYWRAKLRGDGASRPGFVELTPIAAAAESSGWDVELELGRGVILRVRRSA